MAPILLVFQGSKFSISEKNFSETIFPIVEIFLMSMGQPYKRKAIVKEPWGNEY
jgi:hypothetical protein